MSSDDSDKTVFRQPANTGDRTVMRPTPGGRGAGRESTGLTQHGVVPQARQAGPAASPNYQDSMHTQFRTLYGLNPLVNAASMLLAVYEKTHLSMSHPDVGGLHQRLTTEIKNFDNRAREQGIKPELVLAARYILCTVLDEAVLNTPWGAESAWPQRTLLSIFHNETAGGEKFFTILDRIRHMPSDNLYLIELMYICLSMGFEGKYRVVHRGKEILEQTRDELFSIIRRFRGEYERDLSSHWKGLGQTRSTLAQYIPMWVVASVVGGLMMLSYSGFRYWLYLSSSPVAQQLEDIANNKTPETKFLSGNKFKNN